MKIEFWMTGDFGVYTVGEDTYRTFTKMDDAVDFVSKNWVEGDGETVDIVDMTTGEILLHFEDEEDYNAWDDYDSDFGYNPYLGQCDWDC